ncbi:MAG TPA: DNA polymerase III subunit gamma/tau, partial [Bryobacteraceae bacterium]
RPQTFSELVSQEHVRTTIENAIAQQLIAHGYIFAGQRGTGKTTVARILARCLNCIEGPTATPCGKCASCIEVSAGNSPDVIEIDAASNRGINEMRELRENVRYRPARDRYKVFIIDEAHQITTEAFNALLKTLEEPPEWAVFVLCTTEAHKIPVTIASRCQQFSFRGVDFEDLIERIRWICGEEGVTADEETLAVLAQAGDGSVRDSLSALDQAIACCGTTLKEAEVRTLLGMFSLDSLGTVARALKDGDSPAMLDVVLELERNGRSLQHFARELSRYMRNLLVKKIAPTNPRLVAASPQEQDRLKETASWFSEEDLTRYLQICIDIFKELQQALQPRLHLELGLLRMIHAGRLVGIEEALASLGSSGGAVVAAAPRPAPVRTAAAPAPPAPVKAPPPPPSKPTPVAPATGSWRERLHRGLMNLGLPHTADAVEQSELTATDNDLLFIVPGKLQQMALADLNKVIEQIAGKPMRIQVRIGKPTVPAPAATGPAPAADADPAAQRALDHPEVQRFRELFPEGHVRQVRDLKE